MLLNNKMKIFLVVIILLAMFIGINSYLKLEKDEVEITYNVFLAHVEQGLIEEVELSPGSEIKIRLKNGSLAITDNPRSENFKEELLLHDIKVVEKDEKVNQLIPIVLFISIMGFMVVYLNKNMSKQAEKEMGDRKSVV